MDYEFTDDEIEISQCETVLDVEKFVKTHIDILDANSGKSVCKPYYDRLLKVYKLLNLKWNENKDESNKR